jgi:glycine/D-amino acid oxidase-like deaminating enzyme
MRVVICGGGVIGACTAYFLSLRGVDVIVVERAGVANAASGKAGGFLARDWCSGSSLDALARRSFALHARLPDEVDGDWGYRPMSAYAGFVAPQHDRSRRMPSRLGWLADGVLISAQIGTTETTAIAHPAKFTTAIMQAAQKHGVELRRGQVTGVSLRAGGSVVRGVEVDGSILEADAFVFAMGPWSIAAADWLRLPAVFGHLSPSLVFDTGKEIPAEALFLDYQDEDGTEHTVEVFPRADGSTLVTAFSSTPSLPSNPADVAPDPHAIQLLQALCVRLSPAFSAARIIARQACFRPVTRDGLPLIGKVPGMDNAYVATGHNVWGILNAPATGEAMAELIVEGAARSVDLSPFDPSRLQPLDPAQLRTTWT